MLSGMAPVRSASRPIRRRRRLWASLIAIVVLSACGNGAPNGGKAATREREALSADGRAAHAPGSRPSCPFSAPAPGAGYSAAATPLNANYVCHQPVRIAAPDGRSALLFRRDGGMPDTLGTIGTRRLLIAGRGPNEEAGWSPDSRGFFVTWNEDGGAIGDYRLAVGLLRHGGLSIVDLSPLLIRSFRHPGRCFEPETPNIAGIAFLGDSRRLLAVAQVVPHSNCDGMGTFEAFVIDPAANRVIERIGQIEAKRRYRHLLGPILMNAEDKCFTDPPTCHIPQLHPGPSGVRR